MSVICNATPLINFSAINRLDILQNLFGKVFIPNAVMLETTSPNFPSSKVVVDALSHGWLKVKTVCSIRDDISDTLDLGEREVIALALEIGELKVLLDEREARKIAHALGLQVIGSLGILLLAKNRQMIPEIKPLLDTMMDSAQYWVNNALYSQVLSQAGELS